jgi:hypothetical protein
VLLLVEGSKELNDLITASEVIPEDVGVLISLAEGVEDGGDSNVAAEDLVYGLWFVSL